MNRSDWNLISLRIGFVVVVAALAAAFRPFAISGLIAAACGVSIGLAANLLEIRLKHAGVNSLIGGAFGMLVGCLLSILFIFVLNASASSTGNTWQFFRLALPLLGAYIGLMVGIAKSDLLDVGALGFLANDQETSSVLKILDTSVLIDGRISDIAESGFLDGKLVVPQFVLHELQLVADSSDSAKRNRGRRGLDIVQRLQKMPRIQLQVSNDDSPGIRDVDLKLIELAKLRKAKIVTNDFNLNKLAQVQGVEVLNINELANALKPVVLPGEAMRVFILKEGKEYNQGVAYLDDGTMVVVDNARRLISKTVDITVTSVLQTTAGKMIFGRYDERPHAEQRIATGTLSSAASAGASSAGIATSREVS